MEVFYRALQHVHRRGDGDTIDHLSGTTTVTILIVAALLVSAKQYVFQPIQCWVPASFTSAMEQYTENYCYVQNTYWVGGMDTSIPEEIRRRQTAQLSYYQWVPFILLGQAAFFYAPRIIWRSMSGLSGIDFYSLHTMAHDCQVADAVRGENLRRALANYIISAIELSRSLQTHRSTSNHYRKFCPIVAYITTKVLYFANAIAQLFLLNAILGGSSSKDTGMGVTGSMGLNLIQNLVNNTDWSVSGLFPRVTLCDFEIRVLGNVHRHTVQCVLMINMFNEKLYASLWVWTTMVAVATLFNLGYWCYELCLRSRRQQFIGRLLSPEIGSGTASESEPAGHFPHKSTRPITRSSRFVDDYLNIDGVFLLRSVDNQIGSVMASQLALFLYEQFLRKEHARRVPNMDRMEKHSYGSVFLCEDG